MSLHWTFSAFPAGTFSRIFGSTSASALTEFLDFIRWVGTKEGSKIDIPAMQELARQALTQGLDYSGRSSATAAQLDQLVSLVFTTEGEDALGSVAGLRNGGIDGPDHIWAQFGRRALGSEGGRVLRWLEQGRRWRTTEPCANVWGAHLVLMPAEVAELLVELRQVIARGAAESGYREHVEEFVLPELEVLVEQGVELVGCSG